MSAGSMRVDPLTDARRPLAPTPRTPSLVESTPAGALYVLALLLAVLFAFSASGAL